MSVYSGNRLMNLNLCSMDDEQLDRIAALVQALKTDPDVDRETQFAFLVTDNEGQGIYLELENKLLFPRGDGTLEEVVEREAWE